MVAVVKGRDRWTKDDTTGSVGCAAGVIFGAVDQVTQPAGERHRRDAKGLCVVLLVERSQRHEAVRAAMAEQCVDENFELVAIGFEHKESRALRPALLFRQNGISSSSSCFTDGPASCCFGCSTGAPPRHPTTRKTGLDLRP